MSWLVSKKKIKSRCAFGTFKRSSLKRLFLIQLPPKPFVELFSIPMLKSLMMITISLVDEY